MVSPDFGHRFHLQEEEVREKPVCRPIKDMVKQGSVSSELVARIPDLGEESCS